MPKNDSSRRDPASAEAAPRVAPARILVVEDKTVDEACALLDREPLDLLLLDVQIPGGGGEAVIREVRQRADLADLPIVAVTSLAMPGDRERLLSIGFQGYLSKPIDTRTFGPAVESYLKSAETIHVRQAG